MTHSPENPFGCTECWGPDTGLGPLHVCNFAPTEHRFHQCVCGAVWDTTEMRQIDGPGGASDG